MKKYNIGYICGVFDLFHVGHLIILERCKSMCNYLIVGICNDDYVINIKNKKPIYSESQRVRIINALKVVDKAELVTVSETLDKKLALDKFHFDVLFSGDDWKGTARYLETEKELGSLGVSFEFFPYTNGISSSQIRDKLLQS